MATDTVPGPTPAQWAYAIESTSPADVQHIVGIDYTNHRGERGWRIIIPRNFYWGATEWHPEPQWLLNADDVAKDAERDFALAAIHGWRPVAPDATIRD